MLCGDSLDPAKVPLGERVEFMFDGGFGHEESIPSRGERGMKEGPRII